MSQKLYTKEEYLILETDVFTYKMEKEKTSSFLDLKKTKKLQQKNRIRLEFQWEKKGERDKSFYFSC